MAMEVPGTSDILKRILEEEMQAAREDFRKEMNRQFWGPSLGHHTYIPPKVTRRMRMKWAVKHKVHDARQAVAMKIAPWLHDDYY